MTVRKAISLTEDHAHAGNDFGGSSSGLFTSANTRWVRVWAAWDAFAPSQPDVYDTTWMNVVDGVVQRARNDGRQIVMTVIGVPPWLPGTSRLSGINPGTRPDRYWVPADVSTTSYWGKFIAWLFDHYGRGGPNPATNNWVEFLEICNEPNLQMWPQQNTNRAPQMHCTVGQMMQSAHIIQNSRRPSNTLLLAGPGCADYIGANSVGYTNVADFTDSLLLQLHNESFVGDAFFAYSQHNYIDVERGRYTLPTSPSDTGAAVNRAALTRAKIASQGWAGWPNGSSASPGILLTEGGARLGQPKDNVGTPITRQDQQTLVNGMLYALDSGNSIARDIQMMTNYELYGTADPNDSGLCEPYANGGAKRLVFDTWASYPPS